MTNNAGSLVAYQARQRQKTIDAIAAARQAIETEMTEHGYPHTGGHLSKLEVPRRAGVWPQSLTNAAHKQTGEAPGRRLARIKKTARAPKPGAEDAPAGRIAAPEKKFAEVIEHCDRFKLEYNDLLHRCEEPETDNAALRRQVAVGARRNVVTLDARR